MNIIEDRDFAYLCEVELQGFDAQVAGATRDACPFAIDTAEWQRWQRGFFTASVIEAYSRRPWPIGDLHEQITVH